MSALFATQVGRLYRIRGEAFWVFIDQLGSAALGFAGIKILTRLLGESEYGLLALGLTVVALMQTNVFGPLGQASMRFFPLCRARGDQQAFHQAMTQLITRFAGGALLFTVCALPICWWFFPRAWLLLLTAALGVGLFSGIYLIRTSVLTAARHRRTTALLNLGMNAARPGLAALCIVLLSSRASTALAGQLLAALVLLFIADAAYAGLRRVDGAQGAPGASTRDAGAVRHEILVYTWPFIIWSLFGWLHMSCDRWVLEATAGEATVGAYAVIGQLAIFATGFGMNFLSTLVVPIAFGRAGDLTDLAAVRAALRLITQTTLAYGAGAVLLVGAFWIFNRPLILLISNERFVGLAWLLPWLTAVWALFNMGQLMAQFGLLANRPALYVIPKAVAAAVAVAGTATLGALRGPQGVVEGLALAAIVYLVWCVIIAFRISAHPVAPPVNDGHGGLP